MDAPEPPSRAPLVLVVATSAVLLAGLGVLLALFLADRRRPPPVPEARSRVPGSPEADAPGSVPPGTSSGSARQAAAGGAQASRPPEEAALPPEILDLLDRTNWDALGTMMLRYAMGPEPPPGATIPPLAAQILAEGFTRLDAIARRLALPDAQAALYLPAVRTRLSLSWLGAAGVVPTPAQEDLIRRFNREEYGEPWQAAAHRKDAAPLARGQRALESQERYEVLLKGLLTPAQRQAYLSALGADPLRNERIPAEPIRSLPENRAQALAEHWDRVFDHAVQAEVLRGRAADLVWRMDELRTRLETMEGRPLPADSERSLQRRLLALQVEAEATLAPRPGAGSARALRFLPPAEEPGRQP